MFTWKNPHSSQAEASFKISLWTSSEFPLESLEKSMVGMSLDSGDKVLASVGLSDISLKNLWGIVVGLFFLSSWTSSMCPTLMGEEMGAGAIGDRITKVNGYYELVVLQLLP